MKESMCSRWHLRLIVLLILFFPLTLSAAQGRVTVKGQSITLTQAIKIIESSSNFKFFFNPSDLDALPGKNLDCEGEISDVLKEVFAGSGISYVIMGDDIILKLEKKAASTQQKKVEIVGGVVDARSGESVVGATVRVKDVNSGVITDMDGKFTIKATPGDVLVISYIGYETKEVKVVNGKVLLVELVEDAKQLEEVVVTAYGSGQKKASMVGSVQAIRPAELQVPSASLSNSFAGRLAGVIAVQRTGQPGADGSDFYIRGISTMNGATNPLIILDGVEISSGDLDNLDPEIIDGFSILKDATATAMYGTRGANGVMIITTKSGRNIDKPIINFRVEGQITSPTSKPKFVDGATYMDLFNESLLNGGSTESPYSAEEIAGTRAGLNPYAYPNVNWYDELFKDQAFNQNFNVNIRGGGKRVDYFSSVTVNHETGMIKNRSKDFFSYNNNINVMRYSFQNNINAYLGKDSRLSLRLNVQLRKTKQPNISMNDLFAGAINTSPVEAPIYFPDDGVTTHIKWGVNDRLKPGQQQNPVAQLASGYQDNFRSTVVAALEFEQKLNFITEGLRFKALASFKNWSSTTNSASAGWNKYHLQDFSVDDNGVYSFVTRLQNESGGEVSTDLKPGVANSGDRRFYFQAIMDYNRTFGKHDVNAMFIYNQDELVTQLFSGDLIAALPKRKQGVAARLSYAYDGKYLAEVNMGYNGSENFAKGHRWGFFPSIAVGYNISEEAFFEPLKNVFSNMKIRASWGLVGNDNIGGARFVYMPTINLTGTGYTTGLDGDITYKGPVYSRYGNPEVTWEVGKKVNVGLDLQLFNSLNLTMDYFHETRTDIFQERGTIPQYLGTAGTKVFGNLAAMKNQGFDFAADFNKKIGKDWFISFKGTFTYAHNEITKYDESPKYAFQSKVGQSANIPSIMISDGLFKDPDDVKNSNQQIGGNLSAGDIKYVNISKLYGYDDDIVDISDWVWAKNPTVPEIVYGFGPSIRWKNLDFSFFFQGVAKVSLVMSDFHPFGDNSLRNVLTWIADDRWSPDNQNINATYPRLTRDTSVNNTQRSDYWLRNAAFIKLKNAEIGYTYKNMRFYVSGMNLATFSPFKHWDPEQGGGNGLKYPTQRVFNFGFQMTINNNR